MSSSISSAADILAGAPPTTPSLTAAEPAAAPAGNLGLLAGAKAHRDARIGKERLTLWVPGWDGRLAIRFKPVAGDDDDRLERLGTQARGRSDQEHFLADTLVAATDSFHVPDGNGKLVALEVNGRPATWAELADILDVDITADGARGVMLRLFLGEDGAVNGRALARLASVVVAWTADTSMEVDGAIVGESSA
jgi:hypothetical protein